MERETEPALSTAELADLSALADGSLAAARRPEVEAMIAASPELRERYARERDVVARLHAARRAERAPAGLRARLEPERPGRRAPVRRRGIAWPAAALAGAVAVALVIVLLIPSGTPASPTIAEAAALAARGAVSPIASPATSGPGLLAEHVGGLHFPASLGLGLHATAKRTDRLDGRQVVTVYYSGRGVHLAYAIVATPVLPKPSRATRWPGGYYELRSGGRAVLTWRSGGHTCVISGAAADVWLERQIIPTT